MEIFILIIGIAICIWASIQNSKNEPAQREAFIGASAPPEFAIRMDRDQVEVPTGESIEIYRFSILGSIPVTSSNTPVEVAFRIDDITDGLKKPVFCTVSEFKAENSPHFLFKAELPRISPDEYLADWVPVGGTLPDLLICPRSGKRTLNILATAHKKAGRTFSRAEFVFEHFSKESGYLDDIENHGKREALAIQIAMFIAGSDGSIDPTEAAVVKAWASKGLQSFEGDSLARARNLMNQTMKSAFAAVQTGGASSTTLNQLTEEFSGIASTGQKLGLLELCLDVMQADGVADPGELRALDQMVVTLRVEKAKYESLRDKRFAKIENFRLTGDDDLARILAIDPTAPKAEIKKKLTALYNKWNSRATAGDAESRKKAEGMLERIAEGRKKYL